jgi:hypothetical protein
LIVVSLVLAGIVIYLKRQDSRRKQRRSAQAGR